DGRAVDEQSFVATGRAAPGVARVVVTMNHGRHVQATVRGGFFIAATDRHMVKETSPPGKQVLVYRVDDRVLTVTAYDAHGRILQSLPMRGHGGEDMAVRPTH